MRIFARCFLALLLGVAAGPVSADVVKWNINAANPSFPSQTVTGYFYYDTVANSMPNWNVTANGYAAVNTNFIPPSSDTLLPCTSGCSANLSNSLNSAVSGGELNFSDFSNPQLGFYVGLGLPTNFSLSGNPTNVNLVGGSPFSEAVAENPTNPLAYTEFNVAGSLTYGGSVLNNFQGGTAANPVPLTTVAGGSIGVINGSIGGSFGPSEFYSFFAAGGTSAMATVSNASSSSSYTFELLSYNDIIFDSIVLDSLNNFQGMLDIGNSGNYIIGLLDTPDNANFLISFSTPVDAPTSVPEPHMFNMLLLGVCVVIGVLRWRNPTAD